MRAGEAPRPMVPYYNDFPECNECTWSLHNDKRWELKYINRICSMHSRKASREAE